MARRARTEMLGPFMGPPPWVFAGVFCMRADMYTFIRVGEVPVSKPGGRTFP
jgi:hypothetical protein